LIARLDVDNICDIVHATNNFDKLVLPKGHKEIVQALVETHFRKTVKDDKQQKEHNFDLVQGKGKGLIILLHGAPGVGKTSTAECVAAHTGKPLFSITCGDIGDSAKDVEKNLDRCFQMAHKWGCILLLDEADIFLAKRGKADLKRNALVSGK
jgi:SpoVK/Ycf46/Vps4 family AAA+-type ATPase